MERRQKLLAVLAGAVVLAFAFDKFAYVPWKASMDGLRKEIERLGPQIDQAKAIQRNEPRIRQDFARLAEKLKKIDPDPDQASNQFVQYLTFMTEAIGLNKIDQTPDQVARKIPNMPFHELAVDMTFRGTWEQFVNLLVQTHNGEEFLRIQHLGVTSHYTKENWLLLKIRFSTAAPSGAVTVPDGIVPGPVSLRPKRKLEEFKALSDNNIVSPPKKKEAPKDSPKTDQPKDAPKDGPKTHLYSVTGITYDESAKAFQAVIEDREWNSADKKFTVKEILFCRKGDKLGGTVEINDVSAEELTCSVGEKKATLKAGDQIGKDGSVVVDGAAAERAAPVEEITDAKVQEATKRRKDRFKKNAATDEAEEEDKPVKKRGRP